MDAASAFDAPAQRSAPIDGDDAFATPFGRVPRDSLRLPSPAFCGVARPRMMIRRRQILVMGLIGGGGGVVGVRDRDLLPAICGFSLFSLKKFAGSEWCLRFREAP